MDILLAYVLGVVTVPLASVLYSFIGWARGRSWSGGGCRICAADNNGRGGFQAWVAKSYGEGEASRLTFWLHDQAHGLYARRHWHRKAWGDEWRDKAERRIMQRPWNSRYMV